MSYIRYDIKMISGQDGIVCPKYLRRLTQGMRYDKSWANVVEIFEEVPMISSMYQY